MGAIPLLCFGYRNHKPVLLEAKPSEAIVPTVEPLDVLLE
jgi:hypothetical protein